jgi:F-type H+-transporting ATPase subunit a
VTTRRWIALGAAVIVILGVALALALPSPGRNEDFKPADEFKLHPMLLLKFGALDMSINKAVVYVWLACALTTITMVFIAGRMQATPNRVQTAVEVAYDLARNNIAFGNMSPAMAAKWFSFVATLFLFIFFSNMIGYIPLPLNHGEGHEMNIFGLEIPSIAIYAATANLSIPLTLALVVWFSYHFEGVRAKGGIGYLKSWVPAGVSGAAAVPIFAIEVISHFVRIISLSVRLFANVLAGHLLILFMAGGLAVILGLAAIGVFTLPVAVLFFLFEVGLIATLQAFIFATLTAIYLGEATAAEGH